MSSNKTFGRDEMAALLSIDAAMPTASSGYASKQQHNNAKDADISIWNASETAVFLAQQQQQQQQQHQPQFKKRLRAGMIQDSKRKMEYHKLIEEQKIIADSLGRTTQDIHPPSQQLLPDTTTTSDDDDDDHEKRQTRQRNEPQIIVRKRYDNMTNHQQHPNKKNTPSSSSSSDDSSSSSENDEEIDARRRRIREKATIMSTNNDTAATIHNNALKSGIVTVKPSHSSSSSADSTALSSSSDESSSSEDDDMLLVVGATILGNRPVFVPKHKRDTATTLEQHQKQQENHSLEQKRLLEKRRVESRAMVKEIVLKSEKEAVALDIASIEEEDLVAGMGANNSPPNDNDTCDTKEEQQHLYYTWQVRELVRILREQDEREEKDYEQAELTRRRNMAEDERLAEDIASGKYQKPGKNRVSTNGGNFLQRYYHKGAFFIDDEENDDIRKRAEEYARAATGQDKIDYKSLPKVMQVKKFGFARHSTKYQGLSKEDTTDKNAPQLFSERK